MLFRFSPCVSRAMSFVQIQIRQPGPSTESPPPPMKLRAYYGRTLLLPIAVPLLFAPGLLFTDRMPLLAQVLLVSLVASPVYAALPYLLFVVLVRRWTHGRPERRLRTVALLAPLLFAPVLAAALLPVMWLRRDGFWSAVELVVGWIVPFAVALGYAYVAVAEAGRVVLERRGVIERAR